MFCQISMDKFGLVNFSRKLIIKKDDLGPALQLRAHRVEPNPYHRFLGVLVHLRIPTLPTGSGSIR